jgi:hypothetical protein
MDAFEGLYEILKRRDIKKLKEVEKDSGGIEI